MAARAQSALRLAPHHCAAIVLFCHKSFSFLQFGQVSTGKASKQGKHAQAIKSQCPQPVIEKLHRIAIDEQGRQASSREKTRLPMRGAAAEGGIGTNSPASSRAGR